MQGDISSYQVCSEPNIWVFDNLLSERLLDHVDKTFEAQELYECHQKEGGRTRNSSSVHLHVDQDSQEIVDVIASLGHISQIEPCQKLCISDVWGDIQTPHVDHINVDDIMRTYQSVSFVDMTRQSASKKNARKIVPTFSFVIYFNSVGGVKFPDAKLPHDGTITGKRGRIIMFQNYIDSQRPAHNPMATHYGFYFDGIPKRVMAMGILANETPNVIGGKKTEHVLETQGLIYCPGVNDDGIRHDWYTSHHTEGEVATGIPSEVAPKKDLFFVLEAVFEKPNWRIIVRGALSGDESYIHTAAPTEKVSVLREAAEKVVNAKGSFNIELMLADGVMVSKADDDWPLEFLFSAPPEEKGSRSVVDLLGLEPGDQVRLVFESWDTDGTGTISQDELVAAIKGLDASYTEEQLADIFAQIDLNKDGKIVWEEFLQWIFGVDMSPAVWKIKRPQVTVALKHKFPDHSRQEIHKALDRCDSNGYQAAAMLQRAITAPC